MKNFPIYFGICLLVVAVILYLTCFHAIPNSELHVNPDDIKFFGGMVAASAAALALGLFFYAICRFLYQKYKKTKRQKRLLVSGKA